MSPDPVSSDRPHDGYGLRAGWYDLRAWLETRTRVLREPALGVAADPGLPFSAARFAGFAWIILPSGLLAGLAMLAAVLVEMPESAFDLTIETLAETRGQVAPDAALRLAAGIDEPPDEARWQVAREQASAVTREFVRRSLRPGLALDGPQVDGAARTQAQAEIIALVDELAAPWSPWRATSSSIGWSAGCWRPRRNCAFSSAGPSPGPAMLPACFSSACSCC